MSIHRPKRATSRRPDGTSSARASSAPTASKPPKWKDIVLDKPEESFVAYSTGSRFEQNTLVSHPKFGKGIVLEVDGNKVHVLFEEGLRRLLHGMP